MSENCILEVPPDFGILNSSLEHLSLANNSLAQVGTSLCRGFGHLRQLDLSHNRIRELTDKLRELTSLEIFDLSFNQLAELTYELCNDLKNLRELNLSNNILENLPIFTPASSRRLKSASSKSVSSSKLSVSRSGTPHSNLVQSPSNTAIG